MTIVDIIGYAGTVLMFACFIPQLTQTLKSGNADGVTLGYCLLGSIGMVCLFVYVAMTSKSIQLMINYAYNAIAFGIVLKYKIWPRKSNAPVAKLAYAEDLKSSL